MQRSINTCDLLQLLYYSKLLIYPHCCCCSLSCQFTCLGQACCFPRISGHPSSSAHIRSCKGSSRRGLRKRFHPILRPSNSIAFCCLSSCSNQGTRTQSAINQWCETRASLSHHLVADGSATKVPSRFLLAVKPYHYR